MDTAAAPQIDLSSTPADANEARSKLDELRGHRIAGLVPDHLYVERADFLARRASGEQATAPDLTPRTSEEQLAAAFEQAMAPAKAEEYQFAWTDAVQDEAGQAFDRELRTGFAAAGIPAELGASLFRAFDAQVDRMANATPEEQQSAINVTAGLLRQRFGDQFKARMDAIDELVANITAASPALAELVDSSPWLTADLDIMFALDLAAQYRKRKA